MRKERITPSETRSPVSLPPRLSEAVTVNPVVVVGRGAFNITSYGVE